MKINPTLNPEIFDIFINYAHYFCEALCKLDTPEEQTYTPYRVKVSANEFSKLSSGYVSVKALIEYYERVNKVKKSSSQRNRYVSIDKRDI